MTGIAIGFIVGLIVGVILSMIWLFKKVARGIGKVKNLF